MFLRILVVHMSEYSVISLKDCVFRGFWEDGRVGHSRNLLSSHPDNSGTGRVCLM